jgi:tryptophan halogenase
VSDKGNTENRLRRQPSPLYAMNAEGRYAMAASPIERVAVIGGGTAGWMTAAALGKMLAGLPISVQLVESAAIGTVGVGEATVPHIRFFNQKLGFNEAEFMRRTQATFKLGIEFRDWARIGDSYIHPFGAFGEAIGGVAFHRLWAALRRQAAVPELGAYSVPVMAARSDRFAYPSQDSRALLSTYSYAFQFDAGLYAAFLREFAEGHGVARREGKIVRVLQDGTSGYVTAVELETGERIEADLFVDCSGFRALLIEDCLQSGFEDWSHWLPCDRAVAMPSTSSGPLSPYTRATASTAGWFWRIPLQHRVGNGHVYCSDQLSDDEALAQLAGQIGSRPLAPPNFLRFKAGKRRRQWHKNVVAIGLAAGFLEPLESTSIHLIQLAIGRLLDFFPDTAWDARQTAEFNRLMDLEYERVRDFLILHYHATERDDSPFWNHVRTMQIPRSLAEKMALFRERGEVVNYRDGMFLDASWIAVYSGQRVLPECADPRAARIDSGRLKARVEQLRRDCEAAAAGLPDHRAFIRQIGANAD